MKDWEVWTEGYAATGEFGSAILHGVYRAETFQQAVEAWLDEYTDRWKSYDSDRMTFWGCRFYDNERDARAFLG